MNLTITPKRLAGAVAPPPSKSQAHRLLIASALAGEETGKTLPSDSQDIAATRRCLSELKTKSNHLPHFDCGESGSTLRFLIPLALVLRGGGVFCGRGRLMERPQTPYFRIFDEKGVYYHQEGGALTIKGSLQPGVYRIPGGVSSQFATGLLYALPLLEGDSEIILTSPLESRGYVDMTLEVLAKSGVRVEPSGEGFRIPGRQSYRPAAAAVEADWSQAAFWYAARCLGSPIEILNLNPLSTQGDRIIAHWAEVLSGGGDASIDLSSCPDLAPPLAAMAAAGKGTVRLANAARLRLKESDRLASITAALTALGAAVREHPDGLTIHGKPWLAGGTVDCCGDHRIAMMSAVAASRCQGPVTLLGAECVAKSYPAFWEDYRRLGGAVHEHSGQ